MKDVPSVPKDADLSALVEKSIPFKITGYDSRDLGPCLQQWSPDGLRFRLKDHRVSVHVSRESNLNFVNKNFEYEYMTIAEMFRRIEVSQSHESGPPEYLYYRSLGTRPRKDRATLASVDPYLEETFRLPENIAALLDASRTHSTVFRISQAGLELWTHYDALDNFLFQVHGTKYVLLFPPSCLHKLAITDTSSPYKDVCKAALNSHNPDLESAYAEAFETTLSPGEVLFIPSAWSHGVLSRDASLDACVSVNLFFANEDVTYLSKNIYGNEDPAPMKRACELMQGEVCKLAEQLPLNFQKALWSKLAAIALDRLKQL